MNFAIVVHTAPGQYQGAETALRFAQAVLAAGHSIYRIFFYRDGVHNGSALTSLPQDEYNIPQQWQTLAQTHQLDLVVCIAAAVRRGVLDANEANRYERPAANLASGFELSGLGQLVDAGLNADRIVTFGGRS